MCIRTWAKHSCGHEGCFVSLAKCAHRREAEPRLRRGEVATASPLKEILRACINCTEIRWAHEITMCEECFVEMFPRFS